MQHSSKMAVFSVGGLFCIFLSIEIIKGQYTCQCETGCSLPYTPTQPCSGGCRSGYYDKYCQTKNVALGKKAHQISTYSEYLRRVGKLVQKHLPNTPDKAVDGNTNSFYSRRSCTHTGLNETSPYWTVDLGGIYTVYKIIIYQRSILTERLTGFQVRVDNNLCYQWDSMEAPPIRIPLFCQQPVRGRNVTIRLPPKQECVPQILTLCEVLVLVCNDYWFGERCDRTCNCRDPVEICHPLTGQCSSGCARGYAGDDCQMLIDENPTDEKPELIGRITSTRASDTTSSGGGDHLSSGDITAIFFGVLIAAFTIAALLLVYRRWRLNKTPSTRDNRYDDLIRGPTASEHLYVGMSEGSGVEVTSDKEAKFTYSDDHYEYVGGGDGYLEPVSSTT